MYLIDTDILSESAKPAPNERATSWVEAHEAVIHISIISIGEIHYGIELLEKGRKQTELRRWLEVLRTQFAESIVPLDEAVALRWGTLRVALEKRGRKLPVVDSLLAATAIEHNLTLVTANIKDFVHSGAKVLNPLEA